MLKIIFYIQIAVAVFCLTWAVIVDYFMRPLSNFAQEQEKAEQIIIQDAHVDLNSLSVKIFHEFSDLIYTATQINFWLLCMACTGLFFCGLVGLSALNKANKHS